MMARRRPNAPTEWKVTSDYLSHCRQIWCDTIMFLNHPIRHTETTHHLIENKQSSVLLFELTQKTLVRCNETNIPTHRLDYNSCNIMIFENSFNFSNVLINLSH